MFDLFPDQPSYEYPALINVLFALVWSFVLSSVVAITHKLTYRGDNYPKNFFQAMVLGGIITAMLMMAIGDSLARGLGVFGAMAIIRFRTRIDDPRDVLFLFAALSTGLAIGVYGYSVSFAGTLVFCLAAGILHFTSFKGQNHKTSLSFTLDDPDKLPRLQEIMAHYCEEIGLRTVALNRRKEMRYEYYVIMLKHTEKDRFLLEMSKIDGVSQLRIDRTEVSNF